MLLTRLPPLPRNKSLEQACGFEALHYKEALIYGQQCRETALEEAAELLLNAGFRSTGIPAYEALAERIRKLK